MIQKIAFETLLKCFAVSFFIHHFPVSFTCVRKTFNTGKCEITMDINTQREIYR